MSTEKLQYDHSNKEQLLHAIAGAVPQAYLNRLLQKEIDAIGSGETNPDFLELLSGQSLLDSIQLIQKILSHSSLKTEENIPSDPFNQERQRKLINFFRVLESMLTNTEDHQNIPIFIYKNRKIWGFPNSKYELKYLTDLLMECFNLGLDPGEELFLVNYPGSFSPAPHIGHIEVTNLIGKNLTSNSKKGRIATTTVSRDAKRLTSSTDFISRLDNMYRGFMDSELVTVLGIPGDMVDLSHRVEQLLMLSQFDKEKRLRFVLGSDNFMKKIQVAQDGDVYARFLLDNQHQLFISVRPNEDEARLQASIHEAELLFSITPVILPKQKVLLSGTKVRSLPIVERSQFYPNDFVINSI